MSFQTGLSGLNAASQNLNVIGHNIANANTVGMKAGRAEFAEMVASAIGASGGGQQGIGVKVATVSQLFTQGNLNITGNNLDVAINGGGFFAVTLPDGTSAYTRDGQFKLTRDGEIVTNTGAQLMGYPTDTAGNPLSVSLQPMVLPTGAPIPANATGLISAEFNLDARAVVATSVNPPTPVTTYGTSLIAFDSQGVEVPVSFYFVKTEADEWQVFTADQIDAAATAMETNAQIYEQYQAWLGSTDAADVDTSGAIDIDDFFAFNAQANQDEYDAWVALDPVNNTDPIDVYFENAGTFRSESYEPYVSLTTMTFTNEGLIESPTANVPLTLTSPNPNIGDYGVEVDFSKVSQFGTKFAVTNLTQDGYTAGELTGLNIDAAGVVMARYSNGQTQAQGQIALADFRNVQGLGLISGGNWVESFSSGQPLFGSPGIGKFGALQSGALEASNVDITAELVNMITAQRSYQANAQTIKTMDQVQQTLVNLR